MTARVTGVRSVAIDVCALDETAAFYSSVWNLTPVGAPGAAHYFRGTGAHHHILSLHAAARPAIRRVVFGAAGSIVGLWVLGFSVVDLIKEWPPVQWQRVMAIVVASAVFAVALAYTFAAARAV